MRTLLVALMLAATVLAVVPMVGANPLPPPQCMEMYSRTDVGQLSIVRRDSCHAEFYECPYEGAPISECSNLLT